jgi:hypothetical protein
MDGSAPQFDRGEALRRIASGSVKIFRKKLLPSRFSLRKKLWSNCPGRPPGDWCIWLRR